VRREVERGDASLLIAGRVGRPHGLDGSFRVVDARSILLGAGATVSVGGAPRLIARRGGTDDSPIVRLEGCDSREDAEALRGEALAVERERAPALEEGEFWAEELAGCRVLDGGRLVGTVRRLLELPSCEVLEVACADGDELLVPLVRDAIRSVDIGARRIEVDMGFVEGKGERASGDVDRDAGRP
jgi:16S rRNA processing protein RimM